MELKEPIYMHQIEGSFPNLYEMILIMYHDNGGRKELHKCDKEMFFAPTDLKEADKIAENLGDWERETIAAGDQDEAVSILKGFKHGSIVTSILTELFEGPNSIMHA